MAGWFGGRISQPVLTPLSSVDDMQFEARLSDKL